MAISRFAPPVAPALSVLLSACLTVVCAASQPALAQDEKPLPNVDLLRQRALLQSATTEIQRERYLCRVRVETTELDKNGNAKKVETEEREIFFLKGRQISRTLAKNGRPVSEAEARREDEHVRKQIEEAERGKTNPTAINQSQVLRLFRLSRERRVMVNGRPTILFDGAGDPAVKANGIAEHVVQSMEGTIAIDEQTGRVQDTDVHGVRDVKLGAGLLADIHKGFVMHITSAPRPDGVWLVQEARGSGDARIGFFLHPSYRFQQETQGCKLFNVTADSVQTLVAAH